MIVFMLTGCAGPDDSIISQSKTQQLQIQANAEQQQQQALAQAQQNLQAQQALAQQATALQQAQAEAQMARDGAQAQQAEALAQQAQAQQLQANTMSNAIAALDNANERTAAIAQQQLALGVVSIGILLFAVIFVLWRKMQGQNQGQKIVVSRYDNMSGPQLLEAARQAGYMVTKDEAGKWAIIDRNNLKRLNKEQLLLELKG